ACRWSALENISRQLCLFFFFFFQAEDGIRDLIVTGVQTCALPICRIDNGCSLRLPARGMAVLLGPSIPVVARFAIRAIRTARGRSEEHTSELQSRSDLVCRLLLEKKKKNNSNIHPNDPNAVLC